MHATTIKHLLAFARTANDDAEIDAYLGAHSVDICEALGVSLDSLWKAISKGTTRVKTLGRLATAARRKVADQSRADLSDACATLVRESWRVGERIVLDPELLFAAVKAPGLVYLIATDENTGLEQCLRADKIKKFAALRKPIVNAWLDSDGLHFVWPTGRLCFIPQAPSYDSTHVRAVFRSTLAVAA